MSIMMGLPVLYSSFFFFSSKNKCSFFMLSLSCTLQRQDGWIKQFDDTLFFAKSQMTPMQQQISVLVYLCKYGVVSGVEGSIYRVDEGASYIKSLDEVFHIFVQFMFITKKILKKANSKEVNTNHVFCPTESNSFCPIFPCCQCTLEEQGYIQTLHLQKNTTKPNPAHQLPPVQGLTIRHPG